MLVLVLVLVLVLLLLLHVTETAVVRAVGLDAGAVEWRALAFARSLGGVCQPLQLLAQRGRC